MSGLSPLVGRHSELSEPNQAEKPGVERSLHKKKKAAEGTPLQAEGEITQGANKLERQRPGLPSMDVRDARQHTLDVLGPKSNSSNKFNQMSPKISALASVKKNVRATVGAARFDAAFGPIQKKGTLFKAYIDKSAHGLGKLAFDLPRTVGESLHHGEMGYSVAMENAFAAMRGLVGVPLTPEHIIALHDCAVHDVIGGSGQNLAKGLGEGGQSYGFDITRATPAALRELEQEKLIATDFAGDIDGYMSILMPSPKDGVRVFHNWDILRPSREEALEQLSAFCAKYDRDIGLASSKDEKLQAIVRFCRAVEIGHFFSDGNQRTVAFLILNKLLLDNGFPSTILEDPIIFDGYQSVAEMVDSVKEGWKNYAAALVD